MRNRVVKMLRKLSQMEPNVQLRRPAYKRLKLMWNTLNWEKKTKITQGGRKHADA